MMTEENGSNKPVSLEELKKTIRKEIKLPQNIELDDILLKRYLKVYGDKDLNKSLELLKYNLSLRKSGSHIFYDRDPLSDEFQRASRIAIFCPLPKLMEENYNVTMISLADEDPTHFDYIQTVKMALMIFDARFTIYDGPNEKLSTGECIIIDGKGTSFRHFLKVLKCATTVRLYMKYVQEAAPINIKMMHFINCSAIMDKMFSLVRPLLKKELLNVIHFHTQGLESLYKYVPKAVLPKEYGGELDSVSEIHQKFMEYVLSKRDYLMNDDNWKLSDQ